MDRSEIKTYELEVAGRTVKVAAAGNLGQTRELIEEFLSGNTLADVLWLRA